MCINMCRFKVEFNENLDLHIWQGKGFSPVCVRICIISWDLWENCNQQTSQWNRFFTFMYGDMIVCWIYLKKYTDTFYNQKIFLLHSVCIFDLAEISERPELLISFLVLVSVVSIVSENSKKKKISNQGSKFFCKLQRSFFFCNNYNVFKNRFYLSCLDSLFHKIIPHCFIWQFWFIMMM